MKTEYAMVIALVRSAITGRAAALPGAFDADQLCTIARRHDISGLLCAGCRVCGIEPPTETARLARLERYKYLYQQATLEDLSHRLSEQNLPFVLLKGSILRSLYPAPEWRTSADIDVLIQKDLIEHYHAVMEDMGFSFIARDNTEEVYRNGQLVEVELHRSLMGNNKSIDAFADIWQRCSPAEGSAYQMSDDDFYLYMIAHTAKHFTQGGCGIRNLLDLAVFLGARSDELHRDYLQQALDAIGLSAFETRFCHLADVWFGDAEADDADQRLSNFLIGGKVFGTVQVKSIQQAVSRSSQAMKSSQEKRLNRMFPSLHIMRADYPMLNRAPFLLPVFWGVRAVQKLNHPQKSADFFHAATGATARQAADIRQLMHDAGLE